MESSHLLGHLVRCSDRLGLVRVELARTVVIEEAVALELQVRGLRVDRGAHVAHSRGEGLCHLNVPA